MPSYYATVLQNNPLPNQVKLTQKYPGDMTLLAKISGVCSAPFPSKPLPIHVGIPSFPWFPKTGLVKKAVSAFEGFITLNNVAANTTYQWTMNVTPLPGAQGCSGAYREIFSA